MRQGQIAETTYAGRKRSIMVTGATAEKGIRMALRFWLCAAITTASALVSAGFSVAGLIGASGGDTFTRYAASRSIALLIAALCCMALRSPKGIAALALVMSLVQGFDGLIGALAQDPAKTYGPLAFAIANFAALVWLLRSHEAATKPGNQREAPPNRSVACVASWSPERPPASAGAPPRF
jgi:hypothetical protein